MSKLIFALPVFAIFLIASATPVLAFNCSGPCDYIWVKLFGFQPSWLDNPRELVINALLPSAAIYVIFLGISRAIRINVLMGSVEHAIAIIVMLAALFTGSVGAWNTWMLAIMGQAAFWLYGIAFLIGIVVWFIARIYKGRGAVSVAKTYLASVNSLRNEVKKLDDAIDFAEAKALSLRSVKGTRGRPWEKHEKAAERYRARKFKLLDDLKKLNEAASEMGI